MDKKYYQITVVGQKRTDDPTKIKYTRDARQVQGFNFGANSTRKFFHLELVEVSASEVVLPNGKKVRVPVQQLTPYTFNCFERSHRGFFKAVQAEIKKNTDENPTFEKDLGDSEGLRIILTEMVAIGAVVSFKLPYEIYRMNRNPKNNKLEKFMVKRFANDGSIETVATTTSIGNTFLYGSECDSPEAFIERAIKAILQRAEPVKPVAQEHTDASAPQNTIVTEEPTETEEETPATDTTEDDGDV